MRLILTAALLASAALPAVQAHEATAPAPASTPVPKEDLLKPPADAVRYVVVVLSQGKSVHARGGPQEALTATRVQVDPDLPPGAYQWRVFAYNAASQMIGCAVAPRTFIVRPMR